MVKPLVFKGDKPKKRKRDTAAQDDARSDRPSDPVTTRPEANEEDSANDDTWVSADSPSDLAGPTLILLPTQPITCLATDANGKIFASLVENVTEDKPSTAEPHDIRQVWLATRVAGAQTVAFRGCHGRYLTCDKHGLLSAFSEALSPEEGWTVIEVPDHPGAFALQNVRDKFLAIDSASDGVDPTRTQIRGDAEDIAFTTTLYLRMQAKHKPKLKKTKEAKAISKISRRELEEAAGRSLNDDEVKRLKRARRDGHYHEAMMDVKVKGKHDKFA